MAIQPLKGSIKVPGDKSLSHRVALLSAMSESCSQVSGLLDSLDVRATLQALEALGAKVDLASSADGLAGCIIGWGTDGPQSPDKPLQCGNSGTTARLLLGVLSGFDVCAQLEGDESLSQRPMQRVTLPLAQMGARFLRSGDIRASADKLPLVVKGSAALSAITYTSPVASAQVKSAILLAGLRADGTTVVTEPHKSRDHTELMLPAYGAQITVEGLSVFVEGDQQLRACDCRVPGDPSSAAFLLVAAALVPDSEVTACGISLNPTRTGFIRVMQRMGAAIEVQKSSTAQLGNEPVGNVTVHYQGGLKATTIAAHEVPALIDEVPILALLAATAQGETVFEQVSELRVKESDRLAMIVAGLQKLGINAFVRGDNLHVCGGTPSPRGASRAASQSQSLETHGDHRFAMTWAVAELAFGFPLEIIGRESFAVSYPSFAAHLKQLQGLS